MHPLVLVAVGGAVGAVARAVMSAAVQARWPSLMPWGTIVVNIGGCLALGLLLGSLESRPQLAPAWRSFAAVGVLGAFTTFSTFELETLALLQRDALPAALVNVAGSVLLGLLAVWTGHAVGRLV